jgi:K+-sensing histidine kinase KdpD
MLKGVHARGAKRILAECLAAISILALVTEGCHRLNINVATCALLYVVVVVVISRVASFGTSIAAAVAAALGLAYFAPQHTRSKLAIRLTSWPL